MAIAKKPGSNTKPIEDTAAEKFISGAIKAAPGADEKNMVPIMIRMERDLRDRIDQAAKAQGLGRSAWLRVQAIRALEHDR